VPAVLATPNYTTNRLNRSRLFHSSPFFHKERIWRPRKGTAPLCLLRVRRNLDAPHFKRFLAPTATRFPRVVVHATLSHSQSA
jgi:hypothetical protein